MRMKEAVIADPIGVDMCESVVKIVSRLTPDGRDLAQSAHPLTFAALPELLALGAEVLPRG
jgi:hypothetical protein